MQAAINEWATSIGLPVANIISIIVVLAIILLIPVMIAIFLPIFKSKLTPKFKIYLYSFITGFFIVMALFGFMREALETSSLQAPFLIKQIFPQFSPTNKSLIYLINFLLVFCGALLGFIFSFVVKYVISYRLNKKLLAKSKNAKLSAFIHVHDAESGPHVHEHPDIIFNKEDTLSTSEQVFNQKTEGKFKVIALVLLLTHRIPEGFILGYSINLFLQNEPTSLSIAFFVSLILHLIPEELVFFYRLRDAGYSRWKAMSISIAALMLFLPFMIIGAYSAESLIKHKWVFAFLNAMIGSIFIFTSLVEFFPEFYHTHFDKKSWIKVMLILFTGILFAIFILVFHTHGQ